MTCEVRNSLISLKSDPFHLPEIVCAVGAVVLCAPATIAAGIGAVALGLISERLLEKVNQAAGKSMPVQIVVDLSKRKIIKQQKAFEDRKPKSVDELVEILNKSKKGRELWARVQLHTKEKKLPPLKIEFVDTMEAGSDALAIPHLNKILINRNLSIGPALHCLVFELNNLLQKEKYQELAEKWNTLPPKEFAQQKENIELEPFLIHDIVLQRSVEEGAWPVSIASYIYGKTVEEHLRIQELAGHTRLYEFAWYYQRCFEQPLKDNYISLLSFSPHGKKLLEAAKDALGKEPLMIEVGLDEWNPMMILSQPSSNKVIINNNIALEMRISQMVLQLCGIVHRKEFEDLAKVATSLPRGEYIQRNLQIFYQCFKEHDAFFRNSVKDNYWMFNGSYILLSNSRQPFFSCK